MNYRELLQKYKAGELPEEQRKQVRQDIEKQDAISEYLFDNEEHRLRQEVMWRLQELSVMSWISQRFRKKTDR